MNPKQSPWHSCFSSRPSAASLLDRQPGGQMRFLTRDEAGGFEEDGWSRPFERCERVRIMSPLMVAIEINFASYEHWLCMTISGPFSYFVGNSTSLALINENMRNEALANARPELVAEWLFARNRREEFERLIVENLVVRKHILTLGEAPQTGIEFLPRAEAVTLAADLDRQFKTRDEAMRIAAELQSNLHKNSAL